MKLEDFDFSLPEDLIAVRPVQPRSASRMLVASGGAIEDTQTQKLPMFLRKGDLLVLNNTKVIPARLFGHRERSGNRSKMEVTLLSPNTDGTWRALIKPLRKVHDGEDITFSDGFWATVTGRSDGQAVLRFNLEGSAFDEALHAAGQMPLPPYIAAKRAADAQDLDDYQTVFAKEQGAVAAPTASLHFDDALLEQVAARGVKCAQVTLHVGAGTFLPVKVDDVASHKMHAEWGDVGEEAAALINETKANGGRIIPVGTTALRLIESAAVAPGQIAPWRGETDIFIYPGFKFQLTDALMTNFHLPKSTLMMLVSALMGQDRVKAIYAHAIAQRYRFFSYGDASLLIP
ncbi:MAG: tRNA preQ1(34) S-adenosylmethionine ribosyltransferase-isomerase QueA [Litoreibacter sp.]